MSDVIRLLPDSVANQIAAARRGDPASRIGYKGTRGECGGRRSHRYPYKCEGCRQDPDPGHRQRLRHVGDRCAHGFSNVMPRRRYAAPMTSFYIADHGIPRRGPPVDMRDLGSGGTYPHCRCPDWHASGDCRLKGRDAGALCVR